MSASSIKEDTVKAKLKKSHGILVPGGFGSRGTEGKILAIKYARENKIPFFGICLGMQLAVIEFARNLLKIKDASSTEFTSSCTNVIGLMTEWKQGKKTKKRSDKDDLGGTMRLGAYDCILSPSSLAKKIYGASKISERHRHRYEFNVDYKMKFESQGFIFSGLSPDGQLAEIIELQDHPWFVGVQFHPELKSRAFSPHPLFTSFVKKAITNR